MHIILIKMKKYILIVSILAGTFFTSCGEYNKVLKSSDYEYKYEAAKSYFGKGQYTKSATILEELITILILVWLIDIVAHYVGYVLL